MAGRLTTNFSALSPQDRLKLLQGGGFGEPVGGLGTPGVVNTAGNPLGLSGAVGGLPGTAAQAAVPGMGLGAMIGRGFRGLAGGPYGVVTPGIGPRPNVGTPQFAALMEALNRAQALNNRAQSARDAFEAGSRARNRSTAVGRRGARAGGRGGFGGGGGAATGAGVGGGRGNDARDRSPGGFGGGIGGVL